MHMGLLKQHQVESMIINNSDKEMCKRNLGQHAST